MASVAVQKVESTSTKLPLFEEIQRRMEAVRRRAFELFERRGRELGSELEDWFKAEHEILGWPAAEMKEQDGKYEVQVTLPGFEPSEVQVTVTPSEIIVHAETKHEKKGEEGKLFWTEFGSNDVYRKFELPDSIDVDKTSAQLEKGILHITATKMAPAKARPIEVRAA